MKIHLKKTTLVILFLLACGIASAQVSYGYDAAGNRISRTITLTRHAIVSTDTISEPVTEKLNDLEVKIYPNPTKGQLNVIISGLADNESGTISIYSAQGQLILKERISSLSVSLDISNQPIGTYIMKIIAGGKSTIWKIIKQ
jgi:hypothetical protein